MDKLLKVSEVAEHLQMGTNSVYLWIKKGWIESIHLPSGCIRIPESELSRIMEV
jgi:predicted site-specific integrase-resolvase